MRDLYDTLVTDRANNTRDKWAIEPDFDELFVWESDDPRPEDEEDDDLEGWLSGK